MAVLRCGAPSFLRQVKDGAIRRGMPTAESQMPKIA
jgi:hypothetical protein